MILYKRFFYFYFRLTTVFCWHLNGIATRFGNILCTIEKKDDETNSFITSIFVEVCI